MKPINARVGLIIERDGYDDRKILYVGDQGLFTKCKFYESFLCFKTLHHWSIKLEEKFEIMFNEGDITKRVIITAKDEHDAVLIFKYLRREGLLIRVTYYHLPLAITGILVKRL